MPERITIQIGGMHCAMCASAIEKALSALPGMIEVRVNLSTEKASLIMDSSHCNLTQVGQAIQDTGFEYLGPAEDSVPRKESPGHLAELARARWRFMIGLALGLPMMMIYSHSSLKISILRSEMFSFQYPLHGLAAWLTLLGFIAFLYISQPIFKAALLSLKQYRLGMDVMYSLGMGVAFISSLGATFGWLPDQFAFYDTALLLATFLTLGRYLETRAKSKTSQSIQKLIGLQAKNAWLHDVTGEHPIRIQDVQIGHLLRVKPGERIPVDGQITDGKSYVDESMLSGESLPVSKKIGDTLYAGTINQNGSLLFQTKRIGRDTLLSQIIRMVEDAQGSKLPIQQLADRVVSVFIPVILGVAILTFLFWFLVIGTGFLFALTCLISVLVIACPCALGLATPTAITVALGRGAELGILIKDGEAFETMTRVTTIVLDKTGTLTGGQSQVTTIHPFEISQTRLIEVLASMEAHSDHPLGEAIKRLAAEKSITMQKVEDFTNHEGYGISGRIGQSLYLAGSFQWMQNLHVLSLPSTPDTWNQAGHSLIWVAENNRLIGVVGIADTLHPQAASTIADLKQLGLKVIMLTGDQEDVAQHTAYELKLDGYQARVLPQDKARLITEMQARGEIIAFVGDGINDAPALAQANVGIAMGSGTDIAIETGQIVLLGRELHRLITAIRLSRKTILRIKQNIFWALAYNTALVPIAAGFLYPLLGWTIKPEIAGLAMAMSSVTVITLSLLLKRFRP